MTTSLLSTSETFKNLLTAFAGESQAHFRYVFFGMVADREGQENAAQVFWKTARGETGHAYKHLNFLMQVADPKNFLHISSVDDMLMAAFQGKKQQSLTYEIASHRATQEKIIPLARLFNDMGNGRLFSLNHLHGCVVWIQEDSIHSKTLKESLTWDALIQAFASECQDNRRCGFYAQKAREKSRKICADTLEAQAEIHHNNALHLLSVISLIEDPVTHLPLGDTLLNLKSAQAGEIYEYTAMYPEMAKKAYEENLDVIADWLDILSRAELVHANGFGKCLRSLGVENAQSLSEQSLKEASFYLETKRYQESSYETLLE